MWQGWVRLYGAGGGGAVQKYISREREICFVRAFLFPCSCILCLALSIAASPSSLFRRRLVIREGVQRVGPRLAQEPV